MPRHHVSSGTYEISEKNHMILEAFLGTCVGVSLVDRRAGVAGLIHLLLSEPTNSYLFDRPETYASTGLPLFIDALCQAGASRQTLEACMAGGALVGPIDNRDLILDIGGRTSDTATAILEREGIPIIKRETGGYFSCCLSLDLTSFESVIEPLGRPYRPVRAEEVVKPSAKDLLNIIYSIKPIPQVTLKVIRMFSDENCSLGDIAREIRQDQILTARVIRLCNSSFFGLRRPTESIDQAIVLLGEKRFLQLGISASMEEFYDDSGAGYSLCKGGLYQHALMTAMIAERLARVQGTAPSDLAYTAGLLHDIGKVVLDQYVAPVYPYFYRRTQEEGIDLTVIEQEMFDITHPEAGGRLAEIWGLPGSLIETIRHHHLPEEAKGYPELVHLIHLADILSSHFFAGQILERIDTTGLAYRLRNMGFQPSQFPSIVDSIPRHLFQESC